MEAASWSNYAPVTRADAPYIVEEPLAIFHARWLFSSRDINYNFRYIPSLRDVGIDITARDIERAGNVDTIIFSVLSREHLFYFILN